MPETALHFSEVTFGFGNFKPLFENLSCSLANDSAAGKIFALMGPSGVGKTTFCDLALGMRHPQAGSVKFSPTHANIAVIPQKGVIFDELSVRDNITCLKYSRSVGSTFREERVEHAVESLSLSGVLQNGTRATALSGGEAQRVMLARIQTIDCDVLILDEPCSFLDNRVKDSFLFALRATVDEKRLLALMVTHVWDEARLAADEVVFFHQAKRNPVTLHCTPINDASDQPPTIDALFGIHWPDCLVLDLAGGGESLGLVPDMIPNGASSVGLFRSHQPQAKPDKWAEHAWEIASQTSRYKRISIKSQPSGNVAEKRFAAAFYDQDGIIIAGMNHKQ